MAYPGVVLPSEILKAKARTTAAATPTSVTPSTIGYEQVTIPGPGGSTIQAWIPQMPQMPTTVPQEAVGTRPQPISKIDPYAEMVKVVPQLPQTQNAAWNAAQAQLNAEVSPATQRTIQNAAARLGVQLGLPSWNLASEQTLQGILGTAEQQVQKGLENYNALLTGATNLIEPPAVTLERETQNKTWAAAPEPKAAAEYALQQFNTYLETLARQYMPTGTAQYLPGATVPISTNWSA